MFKRSKLKAEHREKLDQVDLLIMSSGFASIPRMLSNIIQLSENTSATISEYVKVCELDQPACIRLLKAANSTAFGPHTSEPIRRIHDAVDRLGLRRTREILIGTVLLHVFKRGEPIGTYTPISIWVNSVAVATGNRIIYDHLDFDTPQDTDPFLVGLLLNIGLPLAQQCFMGDGFREAILASKEEHTPLVEEEDRYIGTNHTEIGEYLAQHWKLPEGVTTAIREHHALSVDSNTHAQALSHVTRASQWLAREHSFGFTEFPEESSDEYLPSFQKLSISAEIYEAISNELVHEMKSWEKMGWFTDLHLRERHVDS